VLHKPPAPWPRASRAGPRQQDAASAPALAIGAIEADGDRSEAAAFKGPGPAPPPAAPRWVVSGDVLQRAGGGWKDHEGLGDRPNQGLQNPGQQRFTAGGAASVPKPQIHGRRPPTCRRSVRLSSSGGFWESGQSNKGGPELQRAVSDRRNTPGGRPRRSRAGRPVQHHKTLPSVACRAPKPGAACSDWLLRAPRSAGQVGVTQLQWSQRHRTEALV